MFNNKSWNLERYSDFLKFSDFMKHILNVKTTSFQLFYALFITFFNVIQQLKVHALTLMTFSNVFFNYFL